MIVQVGADLQRDFRVRNEILAPVEVWGLDRFEANWMVVKGHIKTRPLQQWSVARAFNARLKRKMDDEGIEIPVPHMRLHTPPNGLNATSQPDDGGDDESGSATDANSESRRRPAATTPLELRVLKEPPATRPPQGRKGPDSSTNSPLAIPNVVSPRIDNLSVTVVNGNIKLFQIHPGEPFPKERIVHEATEAAAQTMYFDVVIHRMRGYTKAMSRNACMLASHKLCIVRVSVDKSGWIVKV
jgi:hypothetical protein